MLAFVSNSTILYIAAMMASTVQSGKRSARAENLIAILFRACIFGGIEAERHSFYTTVAHQLTLSFGRPNSTHLISNTHLMICFMFHSALSSPIDPLRSACPDRVA